MTHSDKSLSITLIIDRIGIAAGIASLFLIPLFASWYDTYSQKESIFIQFTVIVYLAMFPAFIILFQLNRLLANIRSGSVFTKQNVSILRTISYCCFCIALLSLIMTIWRLLAAVIFAAFVFVGLLLRVLKNVFEQAVLLREENDLTV